MNQYIVTRSYNSVTYKNDVYLIRTFDNKKKHKKKGTLRQMPNKNYLKNCKIIPQVFNTYLKAIEQTLITWQQLQARLTASLYVILSRLQEMWTLTLHSTRQWLLLLLSTLILAGKL
jgi:hypothetical protein